MRNILCSLYVIMKETQALNLDIHMSAKLSSTLFCGFDLDIFKISNDFNLHVTFGFYQLKFGCTAWDVG